MLGCHGFIYHHSFLIIYLCLFLMGMLSMTTAIAHYKKYCSDVISLGF